MSKIKKMLVGVIATTWIIGAGFSASAEEVDLKEVDLKEVDLDEVISPFYIPLEASILERTVTRVGQTKVEERRVNWGGGPTSTYHAVFFDGYYNRVYDNQVNYGVSIRTTYTLGTNEPEYTWNNSLTVRNSTETASASGWFKLKR